MVSGRILPMFHIIYDKLRRNGGLFRESLIGTKSCILVKHLLDIAQCEHAMQ
jgi:hypothetical protein